MSNFNTIIQGDKPVLIDFYADWCGPCQTMSPIIQEIKQLYGDKIRVLKINVDTNAAVASRFKIRGVPTFILFKNGEIQWRAAGLHSRADLKSVIDKTI